MFANRPDWTLSRQRQWGVPMAFFVHRETGALHPHTPELLEKVADRVEREGIEAWQRLDPHDLLGDEADQYEKNRDTLDVWFDSGTTHATVLGGQDHDLKGSHARQLAWPADLYLEGSDQHRGWFHSSLLESCGTRGRAPFDVVLTHGFTLDEQGRKMSKSLRNTVEPQEVIKQSGADILRMWACSVDYADDQRIGPEILKTTVETYRKLRNTIRWMLGSLAHFHDEDRVAPEKMPELERLMLHRLAELDALVRKAYADFDYKRIFAALSHFMTTDLSAFYFDVRKDALYCDPISSQTRKSALTVIDHLFRCTVTWLAPMLCFTAEEAWCERYRSAEASVHLELFPEVPTSWRDDKLSEKWRKVRQVRRVVTGGLELERAQKRIGSSLEAAPIIYIDNPELFEAVVDVDLAEVCITSAATLVQGDGHAQGAVYLGTEYPDGVGVVPNRAEGRKCARSWKISPSVGSDPQYPDVTPRDAQALREWDTMRKAAE
jgi:isoleucyl-tRNA synthetase